MVVKSTDRICISCTHCQIIKSVVREDRYNCCRNTGCPIIDLVTGEEIYSIITDCYEERTTAKGLCGKTGMFYEEADKDKQ